MRHWNFRVIKRETVDGATYGIYECYYDSNGRIYSISENSIAPQGETIVDLQDEISRMARAFKSPVLNHTELPENGAEAEETDD